MVKHVAEPDAGRRVDGGQVGRHQPVAHFLHRADNAFEPAQLAAQAEDAADGVGFGKGLDCAGFEHLDGIVEPLHQRVIAIDDEIEHGMGDEVRPFGQPFMSALQPFAQVGMGTRRSGAHGEDEIAAEENRRLAELDLLALGHGGRARDDEQVLPVDLHLGHLAGVERIFHRQRVQAELAAGQLHFRVRGIGQAHPVELALGQSAARITVERDGLLANLSGTIAARSDHGHGGGVAKRRAADNLRQIA